MLVQKSVVSLDATTPAATASSEALAAVTSKGKVVVLHSRAITALFTVIRDKNTPPKEFAAYADRLMRCGAARFEGARS